MKKAPHLDSPALLAGAGVSADAPTNLPTGEIFLTTLLRLLAPSSRVAEDLRKYTGRFLRLEALMSQLADFFDPELRLLDYYDGLTPANDLHRGFAQLLARRVPVMTTNFDWGIEAACKQISLALTPIFESAAFQKFLEGGLQAAPVLLKVHGSLRDAAGNSVRETVCDTLRRVDRNNGAFGLAPEIRQACEQIVQQHDLVVAGYSGMSDFDMAEMLATTESTRQLIWIRHVSPDGEPMQILGWNELEDRFTEAMSNQRGLPRDVQLLYELGHFGRRPKKQLWMINAPTGQALASLFPQSFDGAAAPIGQASQKKFKNHLMRWAKTAGVTRPQRWHFYGELFEEIRDLNQAISAYRLGSYWAKNAGSTVLAQALRSKMLSLYVKNDDLEKAAELAAPLENTSGEESAGERAQRCLALAHYYDALEQSSLAGRHYLHALRAARQSRDALLLGKISECMGERLSLRGRTRSAVRWLSRSLAYYRHAPNQRKVADVLNSLVHLYEVTEDLEKIAQAQPEIERLYLLLQDLPGEIGLLISHIEGALSTTPVSQVEERIKRAEYLAAIMRNVYSRGMLRKAIAHWRMHRKEYGQAHQLLDQAETDLLAVGAERNHLALVIMRGYLAFEQEDYRHAEDLFYKALLTSQELDDWSWRPTIFFKLAEISFTHSELEIALSWLEKGVKASRRVSSFSFESDCHRMRAEIHFQLKDREAMIRDLEAAFTVTKNQPSLALVAAVHRTAALLFAMTDDWPKAGKHAEAAIQLLEQVGRADKALEAALRSAPILFKHWSRQQFRDFVHRMKASHVNLDEQTLTMLEALVMYEKENSS